MPYPLNQPGSTINTALVRQLAGEFASPFWLYDAPMIRQQIALLRQFDVIRYAQKACSNVHILRLMRQQGVKVDAVSEGEIARALAAGFAANEIVFTADVLDEQTLQRVCELGITVNAGSADMLHQLGQRAAGHRVWLRINPGFGHGHSQKTNTGGENSKHGIWHSQLASALALIRHYGLQLVGLHMHIGSGADYAHLARVCQAMVQQVRGVDLDIQAISAGGGLSVPYRHGEPQVDTRHYFNLWHQARQQIARQFAHDITLEIEPGRFLLAQAGLLLTRVCSVKQMGSRHFVLVDAGFNDLMRPAMYGSYHHISALSADGRDLSASPLRDTVVAGPLCESGDVFCQQEGGQVITCPLPAVQAGDFLLLHDTGAYGASMSSNYNSRPLLAEVLVEQGRQIRLIRRRQTIADLLALEEC